MKILCGLVALLALCTAARGSEVEENPVIHGTINVVLANKNGMVVLTDSMLTAAGKQLPTLGKKLFRLDDHSVCAIAGIIASPSGSYKELDLSTVALIDDYAGHISAGPPITISQKLRDLAFLLNINISAVENVLNANGKPLNPDSYVLQLIVAGYDTDDVLKIGKVTLRSRNLQGNFDSEIESGQIRPASDKLDSEFSGMPDKAELIMAHPETVTGDDAVSAYQASLKSDLGRSFTLEQMAELAKRLKYYSTLAHREVGGPDQIAILQNGKISNLSQPPFPNSAQARRFSLFVADSFSGSSILFRGNAAAVFVRCFWNSMYVPIDGNFFTANEFKDSLVRYDGGPLHFDSTNKVIDSEIIIWGVTQYSKELSDLRLRFIAGRTANFNPTKLFSLMMRR